MSGRKLFIGTGIAAMALAGAIGAQTGSASPARQATPLTGARPSASTPPPAWVEAMTIRSEGLNRRYGLGTSALSTASSVEPAWLRALELRSDALNRAYRLGKYANG